MKAHTEAAVLTYNPWGMDDSDYRVLDDRFLVTRTPHDCTICFEAIPAQTRVRARREAYDGKAMTFYMCRTCCEAMAKCVRQRGTNWEHDIEARYALGQQNADKMRAAGHLQPKEPR
jgi:hypothetical protein